MDGQSYPDRRVRDGNPDPRPVLGIEEPGEFMEMTRKEVSGLPRNPWETRKSYFFSVGLDFPRRPESQAAAHHGLGLPKRGARPEGPGPVESPPDRVFVVVQDEAFAVAPGRAKPVGAVPVKTPLRHVKNFFSR